MERTSIRVPDGELDELKTEAEDRGMSLSQYIRYVLEHRDVIIEHTDPDHDLPTRMAEFEQRLAQLEEEFDGFDKYGRGD